MPIISNGKLKLNYMHQSITKQFHVTPPKDYLHQKEQATIELLKTLRAQGYTEGPYEKPNRIFSKGLDTVKININGGEIIHNDTAVFKGNEYANSVAYFQTINSN
jgi:hypothetical protein